MREEINGLIRVQRPNWATRAKVITTTRAATATATATATSAINPGETAATGQDDIYGLVGLPAHNDAPVTSVDQRAVPVHARLCRSLSCHIPLDSWGKSPRQTSSWLPTDGII
ncbi:MAG: hypothetical protein M1826_007689 [Phylliscum demangeonii]|nr:MAG: hypothetical protein M1826_007689 [Phylliscum demangeonii]